jgi:RNA polymerase sigma-70 factor, ECF subfamily
MSFVKYAKKGSHTAFEALYWYYNKPIWNKLGRLIGNRHIVEELHQETFIRAWVNLQKLDSDAQFEPWLYRIAAHVAIDSLRRSKKLMFLSFEGNEVEEGTLNKYLRVDGPEEAICSTDLLEQALTKLTPQFRTCLVLQDVWGYSQREVAQLLKISISCVGSYVSRGREQLRLSLKQLEGDLS